MIRIPTGPVSKNTARNVSLILGIVTSIVAAFLPQYQRTVAEVGGALAALGLTLGGKAEGP
jgi:hypothetical protein